MHAQKISRGPGNAQAVQGSSHPDPDEDHAPKWLHPVVLKTHLPYTWNMIDDFLFCDWDDAPDAMDFELSYGEVLMKTAETVSYLSSGRADPADHQVWSRSLELFVMAPAIVNVMLNYSVCVQFGLPLHPTEYFEVAQNSPGIGRYGTELETTSFELLARAIDLARMAYGLDPAFEKTATQYIGNLPHGIEGFIYTSIKDKYTWRAAEPAKVRSLAKAVSSAWKPQITIGAAHGSIMAGLFLAELLRCRLWFLRFSMFKRNDTSPVVSPRDEALIRSYGNGEEVLVFDEDSASGTTLSIFTQRIRSMAPRARTGVVIRHQSSDFRPDFVGKTWWD